VWKSTPHIDGAEQMRFELAVIELVSNVIKHADTGTGVSCTLTIETFADRIEAVLRDTGEPGNMQLSDRAMPDENAESGRGIPIIQALVDNFSYERDGKLNIWRMIRNIDQPVDQSAPMHIDEKSVRLEPLASIIESSDDSFISRNPDGAITSWNSAAERMYGYSASEMIGQLISRLIPPGSGDENADILGNIRDGN